MAERRKASLPSQIGPSGNRIPGGPGGDFHPQQMLNQQFGYTTKLQAPPGLHGPFMVSYGQQAVFPQQGPYPHHASSYQQQQQHPHQQQQQQQFQQQQPQMQFIQQHDNVHSMQFMQDTQKSSSSQSEPNLKSPDQEANDGDSSSTQSTTSIVKQDNSIDKKEDSEAAAAKKELEAIRAAHEKQVRELEERIKALEEQKVQKEVKYLRVPSSTQKKSHKKRLLETDEEDAGNVFEGPMESDILDRCPSPAMSVHSNMSIKEEPEDDLEDKIPYTSHRKIKPKPEYNEVNIDEENSEPPKPTTLSITDFDLCIFCQTKKDIKMVDVVEDYLGEIQTLVLNVDCDASQRLKDYICDAELFFNNLPQYHSRCLGNIRSKLRILRKKKKDIEETNSSLCLLCQEHRIETLYNLTSKGIEKLQNDLNKHDDEKIEKLDEYFNFDRIKNLIEVESAKIQEEDSSKEEDPSNEYKWHKKCRLKFIVKNRPRKLGRPRKNEQDNAEDNGGNSADEDIYELLAQREKKNEEEKLKKQRQLLPEPEEFSFKNKCVFCGKSLCAKSYATKDKYAKSIKDDKMQKLIDNAENNQDSDIKKVLEYALRSGVHLKAHEKCYNYYYYGKPQRVKKGTRENYDRSFKAIITEIEDPMFKEGKVFSLHELREKFLNNLSEFEIESDMKISTFANRIKNYYTFDNKCKVIVIPHPDNLIYSKYASDLQVTPQINEFIQSRSNDIMEEVTEDVARAKVIVNFDGNKKWRFECSKCTFKCYGKITLEKHIKKHERFKCTKCDYKCFKKGSLKEHMKEHKLTLEEIEKAKIMCDTCGLMLRNEQSLKNHMKKHSGEKFYCLQCEKSFFNKHSLDSHVLTHTGEKNEECPHCGKRFMLKKYVKGHIKKVHEPRPANWHIRPYLCNECGKSFRTKERLKEHSRKHSDERPFLCNECGASFKYRAPWRTHMLAHEGKKPQMCSICNYGCYTKANLELHMAKHSGINEEIVSSKVEKSSEKKLLEKYNHLYEVPNIKPQAFFPQYRQGTTALLWDSHEDSKPLMHFD